MLIKLEGHWLNPDHITMLIDESYTPLMDHNQRRNRTRILLSGGGAITLSFTPDEVAAKLKAMRVGIGVFDPDEPRKAPPPAPRPMPRSYG